MILVALKMLIGNKASCIGVIFGVFLATLLISQQSAIFLGLVSRSYRLVTDVPAPTIWIMDPATESDDRVRTMPEGYLDMVRSIPEVEWAFPIGLANASLITNLGVFETGQLFGVDDSSLIGAPIKMIEGRVEDLRRDGGIIVDIYSAKGSLAKKFADGTKSPLKVGDEIEINDKRAVVVGLCEITQGFYPMPIIYTTYSHFKDFTGMYDNSVSFILAKNTPGSDLEKVCQRISSYPGLSALTRDQFESRIVQSFLRTGILINFGLSVGLGIIIGFSIAGQIFYIMTLSNLMYYALIKAVGGTKGMILKMIAVQTLVVGLIGFSIGTGTTLLWGMAVKNTTLAFLFPWQLLLFTSFIVLIICLFTAGLSIRKVFQVDPKVLMGT